MLRGSRNPKIFGSSYQPPIEKKPLKVGRSWRAIITVVVVVVLVVLIGRLPFFQIRSAELIGDSNEQIAQELTKLQGQSLFARSVGKFVSQTETMTSVESFSCRKGIPSSLRCTLLLRKPALIWQSGQAQYLVDKDGVIFAATSSEQPEKLVVEDTFQQPIELGKVIVSPEIVSMYQQLVTMFSEKQLLIKKLQLTESLYQVTAIIDRAGKNPIKALFLLTDNIKNQVDSVSTALAQKGDSISERIDVRVPGYVYTK